MADTILAFITAHGYLGVFLLMVLENIFPPIPSEIILPFVGQSVALGHMNFFVALLSATLGSLLGTSFWFLLGWLLPTETLEHLIARYGVYVAIGRKDFHKAASFFTYYEIPAVFFGRLIPAVRSVISIPAGSVRMRPVLFFLYSGIGTLLWNTVLMIIGYVVLDDITVVEHYMNPVANVIVGLFVALYVFQIIRFHWHQRTQS